MHYGITNLKYPLIQKIANSHQATNAINIFSTKLFFIKLLEDMRNNVKH